MYKLYNATEGYMLDGIYESEELAKRHIKLLEELTNCKYQIFKKILG